MATRTMKFGAEGLSHYLRHLGDHSQLTREQEYELAGRARKGDESARQTLATLATWPSWWPWRRSSPTAAPGWMTSFKRATWA